MSNRIVYRHERALTTTVNDIEHIESQSLQWHRASCKIFFHAGGEYRNGGSRRSPPSPRRCSATAAGHHAAADHSATTRPACRSSSSAYPAGPREQQLNDLGLNFVRTQLVTVPGAAIPYPYGGKQRQVQVDLDTHASCRPRVFRRWTWSMPSQPKSDSARRHRQDRRLRIQRRDQRQPAHGGRAEQPARSRRRTARRYIFTMWPTCGTAFRRRPTLFASDGQRASLMTVLKDRRCLDARHHQRIARLLPHIKADSAA